MRLFGGVFLPDRPSMINIRRLDSNSMPWVEAASYYGIEVELSHFSKLDIEFGQEMESLTEEVKRITGVYTNLDSGDQVSHLLFKTLGLKQARRKMTKSGDRESIDSEVLGGILHDHIVVPIIKAYRECSKYRGTYCQPILKLARKAPDGTWRLFPNFKYTRVPSGRFAAEEPNLLAIPAHSKRAKRLREGFITRPGWILITVDLSQIEPRVAAHRSNCEALIKVYLNDEDLYSDFSITAFHLEDGRYQDEKGKWKYPHVDKEEHRFPAKTCTLASLYDVTGSGLLAQMPVGKGWTENKCQDLINSFYLKYPELLRMRKVDHARARQKEMVWDLFGRVLHTPGVKSVLPWVVSSTLRELGNHPIQGTACGVLRLCMAETHQIWEQARLQEVIHPLLPIHDELLYEVREDLAEEWIQTVGGVMEGAMPMLVPIKWSGAQGERWSDVEK
ncbi:MAG TPA: DNA polymerase A family protein [Bacteroidia bacterium]|jgi:DNA polymerase-1|nr:DNA polymerase A family protein [Bacteroidia bacterium]